MITWTLRRTTPDKIVVPTLLGRSKSHTKGVAFFIGKRVDAAVSMFALPEILAKW